MVEQVMWDSVREKRVEREFEDGTVGEGGHDKVAKEQEENVGHLH